MKVLVRLTVVALLLAAQAAIACGTLPPAEQAKIDAEELAELKQLAHAAALAVGEVFVGTVTNLTRPAAGTPALGTVSFAVVETLKGEPSSVRSAQWKAKFVIACQPSAMFHNVGLRPDGKFIVYVRGGEVVRAAAADHLRSGLLSLEQERTIVVGAGGR